jgi:hypothetical protein
VTRAHAPRTPSRCELSIDPAAPKKKGLVKRLISKARHPRSKDGHDQLLGDLVRLGPGGAQVLLDSCSGTWLSELAWDKVRSVTLWAGGVGVGEVTSKWHMQGQQPVLLLGRVPAVCMGGNWMWWAAHVVLQHISVDT